MEPLLLDDLGVEADPGRRRPARTAEIGVDFRIAAERDVWSDADRVASDGGPLALHDGDVLVHVDGKSHDRQFSAIWTAKGAPAAPTEAAMWAADIRQNAQICVWVVKPVRCRTHARGDARLKEQIASVARAAIGQRRRAGNLDFPAVLAIALHIAV